MSTQPNPIVPARQDYMQGLQVIGREDIDYDDAYLAAGTLRIGKLPANARIVRRIVDVKTAFAATATNVLTVGTVSGTANTVITGGDVNETVIGITDLTTPLSVISTTAEVTLYAKFTGAGAANTAGKCDILIFYIDQNNL